MSTPLGWRRFYTLVYSTRGREAVILPIPLRAEFVRVEISLLAFPRPTWYQAGWLARSIVAEGKPVVFPSVVCPLIPSVFSFDEVGVYYLRFKPVPYLPPAIISFYRSIDPVPVLPD